MADNRNWGAANPWIGLDSYDEGRRLFGRDEECATLTRIILNSTAMVLYGRSGVGKSSLLKAAVFPELRLSGCLPVYIRLSHNTATPYAEQIESAIRHSMTLHDMLPAGIGDMGLWDFLHRHRFSNGDGEELTPVIVLDQFEEIFTLTDPAHKPQVQQLFAELADVLNDIKPERVAQAERQHTLPATAPTVQATAGFTLTPMRQTALNYIAEPRFKIVVSMRDDSLFLLERNSAKIPAFKLNRYNLQPLTEGGALDVVTKPLPQLFTVAEARSIVDNLAYYEYDDYRVVTPAILSLFLYSYYKEHGNVTYHDIFENYYRECLHGISDDAATYIEEHLLTPGGYRTQLPYNALREGGVSDAEISHLLKCIILKKEKRGTDDYYEFSHDLLCQEAQKHKNARLAARSRAKMRRLTWAFALLLAVIAGCVWYFWPKPPVQTVELQLCFDDNFDEQEPWSAHFRFMTADADSVLLLPIQTADGRPADLMEIGSGKAQQFVLSLSETFIKDEKEVRLVMYDVSNNCRVDTFAIDLLKWTKTKEEHIGIKKLQKTIFTGRVVDTDGTPVEHAMVALGNNPIEYTDGSGAFTFMLNDSDAVSSAELYVFKQGYSNEHLTGSFIVDCGMGSVGRPLLVAMRDDSNRQASDSLFERVFAQRLNACVALYSMANWENRSSQTLKATQEDSLNIMRAYPEYFTKMSNLRRTEKKTPDGSIDLYCISVEYPGVKTVRHAIGNYLCDNRNHLFDGRMIRIDGGTEASWRLSADAWDSDNRHYYIQGIIQNIRSIEDGHFILERLE